MKKEIGLHRTRAIQWSFDWILLERAWLGHAHWRTLSLFVFSHSKAVPYSTCAYSTAPSS